MSTSTGAAVLLVKLSLQKQGSPAAKTQLTESINDELGLPAVLASTGVLGVHDLRAEYVGPDIVHAGMHI